MPQHLTHGAVWLCGAVRMPCSQAITPSSVALTFLAAATGQGDGSVPGRPMALADPGPIPFPRGRPGSLALGPGVGCGLSGAWASSLTGFPECPRPRPRAVLISFYFFHVTAQHMWWGCPWIYKAYSAACRCPLSSPVLAPHMAGHRLHHPFIHCAPVGHSLCVEPRAETAAGPALCPSLSGGQRQPWVKV